LIIAADGREFAGYDNNTAMPETLNVCAMKPFVVGLLFGCILSLGSDYLRLLESLAVMTKHLY
jgi:hypothetical protein